MHPSPEQTPEQAPGYVIGDEERAREIAGSGNITETITLLHQEDHLIRETARIKENDAYRALRKESWMHEREWQLFTCIELYDRATAAHCFNTFLLLKEKLESTLQGAGNEPVRLLEIIHHDGTPISEETLLRAALLHDIGKLTLPRFLIQSPQIDLAKTLASAFPNENEQALLRKRGFSPTQTFFDALKTHEEHSAAFLKGIGLLEEAALAGTHHNYARQTPEKNTAHDVLRLGATESGLVLGDIIHLADVEEALTSKERTYKKSFPLLKALAYLVEDAVRGNINSYLTFLWVKNELPKVTEEERARLPRDEADSYERTIGDFLKKEETAFAAKANDAAMRAAA